MEHPRSFRSLARRTTGSGKPPTPTTATTSAAPTTVPALALPTTALPSVTSTIVTPSFTPITAPASAKPTTVPASARPTTASPSEPRDTSARKTTTAAKGSRLHSSTRTEIVAALPALPAPLPSDYDAKKAAKGKGHAGDDRKRSSDRDDVIDVDREPKRAQARSASPPRRVSNSVFESKASARSLFSTLAAQTTTPALAAPTTTPALAAPTTAPALAAPTTVHVLAAPTTTPVPTTVHVLAAPTTVHVLAASTTVHVLAAPTTPHAPTTISAAKTKLVAGERSWQVVQTGEDGAEVTMTRIEDIVKETRIDEIVEETRTDESLRRPGERRRQGRLP
ncbi:hypothetical protein AALP_AA6G186700 [Arabis alpina]|nr:hypothetical protein AALP_AA6G186700 [Arabis alpina]